MRFFRDARNVGASSLVAMILLALRAVLVMQIVGPTVIGIWKSALVLLSATTFLSLGLPYGILFRVPYLMGKGREEEAERTTDAAGSFTWLIGVVLGAIVFGLSLATDDAQYSLALKLAAAVILLKQPYDLLRELAGAKHLFGVQARNTLLDAITNFLTTLVLASAFGLAGLGASAILTVAVPLIYLNWRLKFRLRIRTDTPRLGKLIKAGFPYSLNQSSLHFVRHGTLGLVALMLGPTQAGYFALSMLISEFAANILEAGVTHVISPHMQREAGRTGSLANLVSYFESPLRLFAYAFPPVLALGTFVIPTVVRGVLPQYVPGIEAAQVMVWTLFFLAMHSVVGPFIASAGRFGTTLKLFPGALAVGFLMQFLAIQGGLGLTGAAWTSLLTLAFATTAELLVAKRACGQAWSEALLSTVKLHLPLAASIALCELGRHYAVGSGFAAPWQAFLQSALFLLFYAPLLVAYEQRFSMLRLLRQSVVRGA